MIKKPEKLMMAILITISVVSFFWLIANFLEDYSVSGIYQQTDPDSLLFMRQLEQSVLRGEVLEVDEYACFPYMLKHALGPIFLKFLVYFSWIVYSLFPDCQLDPVVIAGFLPVVFYCVNSLLLFFSCMAVVKDKKFMLFIPFFLLPHAAAALSNRFLNLDYDFLISFFIWSFLLACMVFMKSQNRFLKLIGAIIATLFVATWSGTPLFYLFVTVYGFGLWLAKKPDSKTFLDFSSSTMLIAGFTNLLYIWNSPYGANFVSPQSFSFFQPACVFVGGMFLKILLALPATSGERKQGFLVFLAIGVLILILFHDPLLQASGFLFRTDPVHETINELRPLVKIHEMAAKPGAFSELHKFFSWNIFLVPLLIFFPAHIYGGKSMTFLRNWLFIFTALAVYQIRYIRWLSAGYGLLNAMIFYALWRLSFEKLNKSGSKNLKIVAIFLPLLVIYSLQGFSLIVSDGVLSQPKVDLFTWFTRNTPATSGYCDKKGPEYGVLCYWDEGNALAYYTKRPAVVGNHMNGYRTMAEVFSAENEASATTLCDKYKIKYILITNREVSPKIFSYWQYLRHIPGGHNYQFVTNEIPVIKGFEKWFYFYLAEDLGMKPRGHFGISSNFRLAYAAKSRPEIVPEFLVFEKVNGGRLNLFADPGSEARVSLGVKVGAKLVLFNQQLVADANGRVCLSLPYSSGHKGGRIQTDDFYKLTIQKNGVKKMFKVFVDEHAVEQGAEIDSPDIQEVSAPETSK